MPGDPHSGSKVWKAPDRKICKPGENRGKVITTETCSRRHFSTTERIAATFGPACGLPMYDGMACWNTPAIDDFHASRGTI